jgi:hypothetical protein
LKPASSSYLRIFVPRTLTFAIGCVALAWGAFTLPSSEAADNFRDLESRLLRFETFSQETATQELENGASQSLSSCDTHFQMAMLLLEMPLAEAALRSGAANAFDDHVRSLENRSRGILSCAPRESFVWLVAFDLEILHGLLNSHSFGLLARSYETSSNEAWISIRRTTAAVPLVLIAPEPQRKQILTEFQQLIRNGFVTEAARAYLSASQPVRSLLQTNIEQLNASQQKAFLNALQKHGS